MIELPSAISMRNRPGAKAMPPAKSRAKSRKHSDGAPAAGSHSRERTNSQVNAPPLLADPSASRGHSATLPNERPSRLKREDDVSDGAPERRPSPAFAAPAGIPEATDQAETARQRLLDGQCANFELTDLGNVDRFAARNEGRLIYNGAIGWLRRTGEYWRPASKQHLLTATHECVRAIQFEAAYVALSGRNPIVQVQFRGTAREHFVCRSDELRAWGRKCEGLRKLAGIQPHIAAKMNVDDLSNIPIERAGSGAIGRRFIHPAAVAVHCFLKECTRAASSRRVQARILYEAYSVWSEETDQPKCTATMFGRIMRMIGFDSHQSNFNWWIGFELISRAATSNGSGVDNHEYREANSREAGCLQ